MVGSVYYTAIGHPKVEESPIDTTMSAFYDDESDSDPSEEYEDCAILMLSLTEIAIVKIL